MAKCVDDSKVSSWMAKCLVGWQLDPLQRAIYFVPAFKLLTVWEQQRQAAGTVPRLYMRVPSSQDKSIVTSAPVVGVAEGVVDSFVQHDE